MKKKVGRGILLSRSGKLVDPFRPKPSQIDFNDIAVALARINRFTGHTVHPYSVLEHSLLCLSIAKRRKLPLYIQLACLLHDASEAYISDIPSPIKRQLKGIKQIEKRFLDAIWKAALPGITWGFPAFLSIVKKIDDEALEIERQFIYNKNMPAQKKERYLVRLFVRAYFNTLKGFDQ
jgi:5'-deoxynucleotidase YfbR-like HD superfamily hydrolase